MRIAVLSCFNGIWNGGGESWAINLCEHLQQQGHECLLVQGGATPPSGMSFRTVALAVPVLPLSQSATVPRHLSTKLKHRAYLDRVNRDIVRVSLRAIPHLAAFRPDIIVPVNHFWSVLASKTVGWLTGGSTRIVFVGHMRGWSSVERDCVRLGIDGFVATQPRAYEGATRFADGQMPIELIPLGVNIEGFADATPASIPLDHPVVLVVSSLLDYKRVDLAVQAAAKAGLSILVAGDGPNAERVDTLGQTLLGPRRYLRLPSVKHSEIAAYYRAADVFTLPSTEGEAFGIVILEAMAAGLPTVLNDDVIRRWITGGRGWFIDPTDISAYAQTLSAAATAPRDSIPADYLEQFSWPAVAAHYAAFFRQVLPTTPPTYSRWRAPVELSLRLTSRFLEALWRRAARLVYARLSKRIEKARN